MTDAITITWIALAIVGTLCLCRDPKRGAAKPE
jgi:hypothetical protein